MALLSEMASMHLVHLVAEQLPLSVESDQRPAACPLPSGQAQEKAVSPHCPTTVPSGSCPLAAAP
eukprot:642247-Pyramimonas_sp.AAC.1